MKTKFNRLTAILTAAATALGAAVVPLSGGVAHADPLPPGAPAQGAMTITPSTGTGATSFQLSFLPAGTPQFCPGNADLGYNVNTFITPYGTDLATLTYNGSGMPTNGTGFTSHLWDAGTYAPIAGLFPAPDNYQIGTVPDVTFDLVYNAGEIPAGLYSIGVGCVKSGQTERYWSALFDVTVNPTGGTPQINWKVLSAPAAPTGVTALAGDGQATVSWVAPTNTGNSPITGYAVTAAPGGATCTTTGATSCVVPALTNGTAYTFTVTATNAIGTSPASAASVAVTPNPPTAPGAPTGVTGVLGDGEVTVSWTAPASNGGSPITGYAVTAAPGGATCTTTGATSCVVSGLTNGTAYTFTVTATNAIGTSSASSASAPVTPVAVPGAPTGVTGVAGDAQVTVSWTAPASSGGSAITGYAVTAAPGGATCTTTGATSCVVSGLTNGTPYTFTVTATSAIGTSPASVASAPVTPVGAPGVPTAVAGVRGDGEVTVSWTAPASNGGSPITDYAVTAAPGGATCTTTGATSCVVSGLTNGTAYTFTVTATNAIGTSPASSASTPVTPATVPGAPTAVTGVAGNAQATVSWTAPASNGGSPITGYAVTAAPGGATCNTTGATSCVVPTLTNGTEYTFTVTAANAAGPSPASAASAGITPLGAPGVPTAVHGVRGDGQVTVSWTAPASNGGSVITGYTVTAAPGGATCTTTGTTSCVVSGLTNGTPYRFTARATNAIGTSTASSQSSAVTPATFPGAPTAVTGTAGNARVTVSWVAPASNGGAVITGYTVTAAPGGATCTTTGATSCVVSGLTNGTAYTFTATATNAVGSSPASAASAAVAPVAPTVPGAPTGVTSVAGDTEVTVSWSAPVSNGGAAITEYTVTGAPGGACTTTGATSCVVTGLTNGTAYSFAVTATNEAGTSPASSQSAPVTPVGKPSAPTAVTGVAGDRQVTVSWNAPTDHGGSAITGYTATATPGGATCTTTEATSCVVTGLSNGTAYTFKVKATNAVGSSPASASSAAVTPVSSDVVVAVEPGRYWDTRSGQPTIDGAFSGSGRLAADGRYEIQIAGRPGVPEGATGVVANLTVITPGAAGFATLYPCTADVPTVSTVNYGVGTVVANNAIVPLNADGAVCVYTLADADFALDVNGFFDPSSPQVGVNPARYLDTRVGAGTPTFDGGSQGSGQTPAGSVVTVPIAGRGNVPAGAQAVMVNVTAVAPTAPGYLTLYPCGTEPPNASTVNYFAGQVVPNGAVVDLSDGGELCVFTLSDVDILLDVTGYIPAGVDSVVPTRPARLHDSRVGMQVVDGVGTGSRHGAGSVVEVQVTGRAGVPDGATAAFFNIAAVTPDGPGFLTMFPCTGAVPTTSNVNYGVGVVVANNATTLLSESGKVCIYTLSGTDVILDITGYVK